MTKFLTLERIILYLFAIIAVVFLISYFRSCGKPAAPLTAVNTHVYDSMSTDNKTTKKVLSDTIKYYGIQLLNSQQKANRSHDSVGQYSKRIHTLNDLLTGMENSYDVYRLSGRDSLALIECDKTMKILRDSAALVSQFQNKVVEMSNDLFAVSRIKDSIIDSYRAGFNRLFRNSQVTDSLYHDQVDRLRPRNAVLIGINGLASQSKTLGFGVDLQYQTKGGYGYVVGVEQIGAVSYGRIGVLKKISFRKQ